MTLKVCMALLPAEYNTAGQLLAVAYRRLLGFMSGSGRDFTLGVGYFGELGEGAECFSELPAGVEVEYYRIEDGLPQDLPINNAPATVDISYKFDLWLAQQDFDIVVIPDWLGFCPIRNKCVLQKHASAKIISLFVNPLSWRAFQNEKYLEFSDDLVINYAERYGGRHADLAVVLNSDLGGFLAKEYADYFAELTDLGVGEQVEAFLTYCFEPEECAGGAESFPVENKPLVSVCMAYYNHAAYLEEALDSLEQQTYGNVEVIVVNDGSTDKAAVRVFEKMQEKYSGSAGWRFLQKENEGPERTRNYAAERATGEFIVFMDSDNVALPEMLEVFVRAIIRRGADCLTCWFYLFRNKKRNLKDSVLLCILGDCMELAWRQNCLGDTNFIIRSEVLRKLGGFEFYAPNCGFDDWAFLTNLCLCGHTLDVIMEPLFWYRDLAIGINRTTNPYKNFTRIAEVYDRKFSASQPVHFFKNVVLPLDKSLADSQQEVTELKARFAKEAAVREKKITELEGYIQDQYAVRARLCGRDDSERERTGPPGATSSGKVFSLLPDLCERAFFAAVTAVFRVGKKIARLFKKRK